MVQYNLKPTLSIEQVERVCELQERESMDSLRYVVKHKELAKFQTQALAFAVDIEKCLISLDTGLGKTLIATAIINVLQQQTNRGFKWLVVVQNNNLLSTYKKIKDGLWGSKIIVLDAVTTKVARLFASVNMSQFDIYVVSYDALCNKIFNQFLYDNIDRFDGMIVDESHTIGNMTSVVSKMVREVMSRMRYRYMLTATPMMVNPAQVINQMYMIDPKMFEGIDLKKYKRQFQIWQDGKITGFQDLDELHQDLQWRYIGVTRRDLGVKGNHKVRVIMPEPKPEYLRIKKMEASKLIKADYGGPAMEAFMHLILDKRARGEIGVAYVNLNETKNNLVKYLTEAGIRVGVLDGMNTNTNDKKEKVHQAFLRGEYDILLTNITTGRDLQCNYLVFYELTYDFQQYLGRGERGLQGNDLDIVFFIVRNTQEVAYFHDNMLERAEMLELIGGKDVDTLKEAYAELQKNSLDKFIVDGVTRTRDEVVGSVLEVWDDSEDMDLVGALAARGGWLAADTSHDPEGNKIISDGYKKYRSEMDLIGEEDPWAVVGPGFDPKRMGNPRGIGQAPNEKPRMIDSRFRRGDTALD